MSAAKKKPLDTDQIASELSESAFFRPTSTQVDKPTSGQTDKPTKTKLPKYTTHLDPDLILAIKVYAAQHKMKDYEVAQAAFTEYLARQGRESVEDPRIAAFETEIQQIQERLAIEERFRTDTEVRHFKKWLRSHDQPQDSDFAKRFMADTRLPQHGSRALYEAKLRSCGYTAEDITLFQEAWKTMLFTAEPDSQPRLKGYINE